MEALRSAVDPLRPLKRKSTTVIDTRDQDAYLMEDLSILYSPEPGPQPMLGVELKPKWGFLPSSPFVPEGHVKRSVCRFCMQQTLKLKEGVVHHKSDYCPLDLYSSVRSLSLWRHAYHDSFHDRTQLGSTTRSALLLHTHRTTSRYL